MISNTTDTTLATSVPMASEMTVALWCALWASPEARLYRPQAAINYRSATRLVASMVKPGAERSTNFMMVAIRLTTTAAYNS